MEFNTPVQAMSNYFGEQFKKKDQKKEELNDFYAEVREDPEKFADEIIKNINKVVEKPHEIGVPYVKATFSNNEQIKEKQEAKKLVQLIEQIKNEAQSVYVRNSRKAHYSLVAKEQVDIAKKTFQSADRAIEKLNKAVQ
ncbi:MULTISPECIES: hypothetical protein [Priestia]|uniref:Uncharacterized protein n=1 Tax=Priestia megaterium (strain WSH-002) TaxID=1006007 RepID=A0A8D3X3Z9_PRIMW|nr:hypothetical protein [Priestia megaterium]AEN92152.1 hypothetical protein BMWSH_p308 [Priestia megaterium WSH-002]